MKKITFEHEGQMIKYYNKVVKSNTAKTVFCGFIHGAYTVIIIY